MPDYKNYNEDRTKKICFACNEMLDVTFFRIKEKKTGRGKGKYITNICKQCEQNQVAEYRKTDRGIAAEIVRRTKSVSKIESLLFDLDKDWVFEKLNQIEWRCELTGLPFNLIKNGGEHRRTGFQWDSLSIDKIVPSKGYTKNNVRFILNQLNMFKQDGDDERMFMLAKALLEKKDG